MGPETMIRGFRRTKRASHWVRECVESVFGGHHKIENPKMLKLDLWTSDFGINKLSKRPWDPHNQIRLEKLCPNVVSDRTIAGWMTSKRRFWHVRPIHENPTLNVRFSQSGHPPVGGGTCGVRDWETSQGLSLIHI